MWSTGHAGSAVRRVVGVGAIGLLALGLVAAKPAEKPAKVELCHAEAAGEFHAISVSVNAERAHRENHGDGMVGDAVPGQDGFVFDADCVPVRIALVQAVSTDADGNQRLVAELLDTNGDGVPSTGDTVRTLEYPRSYDGTDFGTFTVTEHLLDGAVYFNQTQNHSYSSRSTHGYSSSCQSCGFQWYEVDRHDDRRRGADFDYFSEWGYGSNGAYGRTTFRDYDLDCSYRCRYDHGNVGASSPSLPGENLNFRARNERDDFLDLIWNF